MTLDSFDSLEYYREHFMDLAVWEPFVREVCTRRGLESELLRPGLAGTYPTFIAGERWVIKFFGRLFDGAEGHAVEQEAAHLLRGWQALPVAQVVAEGMLREEAGIANPGGAERAGGVERWHWPYLVYNFLPGTSIGEVYEQVSPAEKLRLAHELGGVIRQLHSLPLPEQGLLRRDWAPFRTFIQGQYAGCVQRLEDSPQALPPHLLAQVADFLLPFTELIDESRPPCFLHGDLTRDHLLGELREGRWHTSGWIDFGDARAGSPDYEWVALHLDLFDGDRALLGAFLNAYGLPRAQRAGFARRALVYTLLFPFNVIGWHLHERPELREVGTLEELAEQMWGIEE
jgi:hygromycin-B 7''-O-kinase